MNRDHLRFLPSPRGTFAGIPMSQSWSALYWFERIIKEYEIEYVIELGTGAGGLTSFFAMHCGVFSVDVVDRRPDRAKALHEVLGVGFLKDDLYQEDGAMLIWPDGARSLLFCDGGDKQKDFEIYGADPENCIVMVHDVPKEFNPDSEGNLALADEHGLKRIYADELSEDGTLLCGYERKT